MYNYYCSADVKKTDSDEDIHVGMVRLLNTETGKKLLLRSFTDRITYIDFALRSEALLGILDHSGAVNVFKVSNLYIKNSNFWKCRLIKGWVLKTQ